MGFVSVAAMAKKWGVSERSVRNYCAEGRIPGAFLTGKTWNVPEDAEKPERVNKRHTEPVGLLAVLREEERGKVSGGIYHAVQIELTYNSNHMEGSKLTHDQTRYIFETNTIGVSDGAVRADDVVETANHFKCVDMIIENASRPLSEAFVKELHRTLKNGTSDARKEWFAVGAYKRLPNTVGDAPTAPPEEVPARMRAFVDDCNTREELSFDDLLDLHHRFELIHPFQDGNGRVGRLLLFRECLRRGIVPFIIDDDLKYYYYRGLKEWGRDRAYLRDTCLAAQDAFKRLLDHFKIEY